MKNSFKSVFMFIGLLTLYDYITKNIEPNFWISIALLIFSAIVEALAIKFKALIAIGSTGTMIFLIEIEERISVELLEFTEINTISMILFPFVALFFIVLFTEILANEKMFSMSNLIFDYIIGIVAIMSYWLLQNYFEDTFLYWSMPLIMLIYYIIIIYVNFQAEINKNDEQ